jgi:hypothetical protein
MPTLARPLVPVLSALLLASPLAASAAAQPPGADSPQALVARLEAAAASESLPEMMACVAPAARREMAMVMVAGVGMMVAFMSMGGAMGAEMAEGLAEGMTGEELPAEDAAQLDAGRQEMEAKAADLMKRYEGILERHGVAAMMADESPLPEDPAARSAELERLMANTDDIALLTDLLSLMEDVGEPGEGGPKSPVTLPGAVTDYRIDGDRATAQAGEETVHFVRVGGRWYVEPEGPAAAD